MNLSGINILTHMQSVTKERGQLSKKSVHILSWNGTFCTKRSDMWWKDDMANSSWFQLQKHVYPSA